MNVSELIFSTPDGIVLCKVNANSTPILNVQLTNTTVGDRNFTIQVNYDWNKNLQQKDASKVKGVILK